MRLADLIEKGNRSRSAPMASAPVEIARRRRIDARARRRFGRDFSRLLLIRVKAVSDAQRAGDAEGLRGALIDCAAVCEDWADSI